MLKVVYQTEAETRILSPLLGVCSPSAPPGEYHFDSSRLGRRDGPAGRNTTASVKAEFHGGTVNISHSAELGMNIH